MQSVPSAMHFLVKIVGFKVLNLRQLSAELWKTSLLWIYSLRANLPNINKTVQWNETADSDLEGCWTAWSTDPRRECISRHGPREDKETTVKPRRRSGSLVTNNAITFFRYQSKNTLFVGIHSTSRKPRKPSSNVANLVQLDLKRRKLFSNRRGQLHVTLCSHARPKI